MRNSLVPLAQAGVEEGAVVEDGGVGAVPDDTGAGVVVVLEEVLVAGLGVVLLLVGRVTDVVVEEVVGATVVVEEVVGS